MDQGKNSIDLTKKWIERFVIGLKLCPFAKKSFQEDKILFLLRDGNDLNSCLQHCADLFTILEEEGPDLYSNGFVIFNSGKDFYFFLELQELLDDLINELGLEAEYQTVVFHPEFQFDGEDFNASGNYTNRSPQPMIHILRAAEVEQAIESHEDVELIPLRNKKVLEDLKIDSIEMIMEDTFIEKIKRYV